MYSHHLLYSRVTWINRVRLPNLLVVSSTRKCSVLADASVVSTYICTGAVLLVVFVYIPDIFLIWGHAHSCTVHCCICIYYKGFGRGGLGVPRPPWRVRGGVCV